MSEPASVISAWESFYVIVGSSAGALIGLQFVVITLIAASRYRTSVAALSAFGTPTVVHLAFALLVSAIMSAPWSSLASLSAALGPCGLGGLAYGAVVFRRARRQKDYKPEGDDWFWYVALPFVSYATLTVTVVLLRTHPHRALFLIGAAALGLLLLGIRNAWDTVTHIVVSSANREA
jgi:hypothetical protein